MPTKPTSLAILQTYSLEELLDLCREKATLEAEEKIQIVREHVTILNTLISSDENPQELSRRLVRSGKSTRGRKAAGELSLRDYLLKVLHDEPMNVDQILEEIVKLGYHSQAQDPRRVLYLELNKLSSSGKIAKAGRGLYLAA